jgi:hypothetical protein
VPLRSAVLAEEVGDLKFVAAAVSGRIREDQQSTRCGPSTVPAVGWATILCDTVRMDEDQLYLRPPTPPRYDERHPTGSKLGFIMEQLATLPTRRELIRFGVWVALGLCVLAMIGLRMWTRWVWEYSLF